jgi:hypothetical protein
MMEQVTEPTQEILNLIVQVILITVPILITWFIRNYVRGTQAEQSIAAITRLSNQAIDYVENLDRTGQLDLPPDTSKGVHKLKLAGEWAELELNRAGIKMSSEEATEWIAAEFQRRVGDVRPVSTMAELARTAVDLLLRLEQKGMIVVPPESDRIAFLVGLAADRVRAELAERKLTAASEDILAMVRAEWLKRLEAQAAEAERASFNLENLVEQTVGFLNQLDANQRLPSAEKNMRRDLAIAWMLVEATKRGMEVSPSEIAQAATKVLPIR